MDDFERAKEFREAAKERRLIRDNTLYGSGYYFDLNQGQFYSTTQNLDDVWDLVKLAREHADCDGYGEHNALLNLVALRSEVECQSHNLYCTIVPESENNLISWHRIYHLSDGQDSSKWMTLRELFEKYSFCYNLGDPKYCNKNPGITRYDMELIYRNKSIGPVGAWFDLNDKYFGGSDPFEGLEE